MSDGRGRKPESTAKQVERVFQLAGEGVSHRTIAKEVFGSAGLHGRVGRILGSRPRVTETAPAAAERDPVDLQALLPEDVVAPELRRLLRFYGMILAQTGAVPSLADIERLLKIHMRLEALAQVERLNAIFREPGVSGATKQPVGG
jgi:hypothetical protein